MIINSNGIALIDVKIPYCLQIMETLLPSFTSPLSQKYFHRTLSHLIKLNLMLQFNLFLHYSLCYQVMLHCTIQHPLVSASQSLLSCYVALNYTAPISLHYSLCYHVMLHWIIPHPLVSALQSLLSCYVALYYTAPISLCITVFVIMLCCTVLYSTH